MSDSTMIAEEKEVEEEIVEPEGEITPIIEPDELDDTDFGGDDLGEDEDDDDDDDAEVVDEEGGDGVWSSI